MARFNKYRPNGDVNLRKYILGIGDYLFLLYWCCATHRNFSYKSYSMLCTAGGYFHSAPVKGVAPALTRYYN